MLIWSLISIFGLMIVHRTLDECEQLRIFSPQRLNQFRLFIFLTVIALNFLFREHWSVLIGFNFVIFLSPWLTPIWIQKSRESSLKNQFLPIVDSLILSLKSGKGFRQSLQLCAQSGKPEIRHSLTEFLSALQYQKEMRTLSEDPQVLFFFQELGQVDESLHRPTEKLKALRRRLRVEKNFRQKSRQATLQVRFQSWIMTLLFLLVLAYVHHDFGISKHWALVLLSTLLFSIGLIVVQRMGGKYQWKI